VFDISKKKHKSRNIKRITMIRNKTKGSLRWLKEEKLRKKEKRKLRKEEEDKSFL